MGLLILAFVGGCDNADAATSITSLEGLYAGANTQVCMNTNAMPDINTDFEFTARNVQVNKLYYRFKKDGTGTIEAATATTMNMTTASPGRPFSTAKFSCTFTYQITDGPYGKLLDTDTVCDADFLEGAGKGNKNTTSNIKGRFSLTQDGKILMTSPFDEALPAVETQVTTRADGTMATTYRVCLRNAMLSKM